jgi:hypothetical protein
MSINLWLATKQDRPNLMYRIMVLRLPKSIGATITTRNNVYPFQQSQLGATGNAMILPLDTDRGVKAYYDRVYTTNLAVTGNGRESHMLVKINLLRKESRDIVYDSANQNIVNSPPGPPPTDKKKKKRKSAGNQALFPRSIQIFEFLVLNMVPEVGL